MSLRKTKQELKGELQGIKGRFFDLLDDLGFSHDIYYNARTPAETPATSLLEHSVTSTTSTASSVLQPPSPAPQPPVSVGGKAGGMSTPRTPRRGPPCGGQRAPDNVRYMYADLLIDQLLARAQTDISDTSNSPPDPDSIDAESAAALTPRTPAEQGGLPFEEGARDHPTAPRRDGAYDLADSVNVNRGPEDTPTKDSAKCKDIPAALCIPAEAADDENVGAADDECDDVLLRRLVSASEEVSVEGRGERHFASQALVVSADDSSNSNSNSNSRPTSSSASSGGRSVPDLDKELVSRIQYYSDFTIDRQKKIDEAVEMPETNDENSPPTPSDHSSEHLSQRCVEGSESVDRSLRPVLSKRAVPATPIIMTEVSVVGKKDGARSRSSHCSKHRHHSSDMCESDTSSGTGSMPRSQQSSRHSSRHSSHSKRSSRDRQSAYSSSGERRSSSSRGSRGSRCSTHPLASSTLISDPSNSGSQQSGSVYTWSLENSSDENLHQSFLRRERLQHRRSRSSHRRSSTSKSSHSHRSTAGHPSGRPATLIGADSPPHQHPPGGGATLHLTHMLSIIESPPSLQFGGRSYENSTLSLPTPRSTSLPRTSTRIGCLVARDCSAGAAAHKVWSVPELSSPAYPDLDYAVARIGPSNLSSDLQPSTATDRSASPLRERTDLPGKSSTSSSATSYYSQCSACNPRRSAAGAASSSSTTAAKLTVDPSVGSHDEEVMDDEILTNSPRSYDSSGVYPPYNSYTSPAGSTNEYTTVSDSSPERGGNGRSIRIITAAPHQPPSFAGGGVFKVPFSPAVRTVRRSSKAGAGNTSFSTQNVGVRAVGTPHLPLGLLKHKEPVSRRKLFGVAAQGLAHQPGGNYHRAPKILDRKALVRKFKKFSTNFKRDKDGAKIKTLANL